jgi:hypothetical protein
VPIVLRIERRLRDGYGPDFMDDRWAELLNTIGAVEPQNFRTAYAKTLLRDLASQAKQSFEALGLKTYTSNEDHIADLLNEAWKNFQSHPESFAQWENSQIEELRRKFGPVA